jgi:hypothetical protein
MYIDMNGADNYPGSESDNNVALCRVPTPIGPQESQFPGLNQRQSCVVHGDTWTVSGSNAQMNDAHVDFTTLLATQLIGIFISVTNNYSNPDPSWLFYPVIRETGNPNGAQEWRNSNYCAANNSQKRRHGNVGGNLWDPGNPCGYFNPNPATGDNFFWGRYD